MYKKYLPDNDYSEYIEDYTVYKCRKNIQCENGLFEIGSLVMLQVCDSDSEKIDVIDFKSVCMRVKNNTLECDYINQIKIDNLWDVAVIPVNMMSECFEKADEVNQRLKNVKKAEKNVNIITGVLVILLLILLFLFLIFACNKLTKLMIFVTITAVFDVGALMIILSRMKKIHIKFCDSIIFGSDVD